MLDALQRVDEAQVLRLAFFQAQLSPSHLRAYLDRLPDFDDVAAEDRALDVVAGHSKFMRRWPFWSRGRPTRAQPDWSACASGKSTAIATSCLTPPLEPSKANTHWPRFCCAAPSSRSRYKKAVPPATNTRLGMSARLPA